MYLIEGKLVSDEVFEEKFVCDLSACKGACCVEGDYGAPLEKEETEILDKIQEGFNQEWVLQLLWSMIENAHT